MDRREVLKVTSAILGYGLAGGTVAAVMSGCKADALAKPADLTLFNDQQYNLLVDITERILPATDTPGAKDANVVSYIHNRLNYFTTEEERTKYLGALDVFETKAQEGHSKSFLKLDEDQKNELLQTLFDAAEGDNENIVNMLKQETITGFFTSEVGANTLRLDPIPGAYNGCIPYKKGDKVWAY